MTTRARTAQARQPGAHFHTPDLQPLPELLPPEEIPFNLASESQEERRPDWRPPQDQTAFALLDETPRFYGYDTRD